jgi:hypothetical protein
MTRRVRYKEFDQISFADMMVYSKLPEHPFWSHLDKKIDFSFADELCSVLYSGRGQHPYAPSLKLKIHLIQTYYGLSDRQVEEKIIGDLFIKRFLGLPVDFFGFDHSTIGLDRSRMGAAMFKACHFYILAQMYSHGLWGDHSEKWIIDSFPSNPNLASRDAYRLIQHAMIRVIQHLKRSHRGVYQLALSSISCDAMYARASHKAAPAEQMLVFSKLVAQAYGLLQWFQLEDVAELLQKELTEKERATSKALQQTLQDILEQNSRFVPPTDDDTPDPRQEQVKDDGVYEKIPSHDRPKDRMMSAVDPEARRAMKNRSTVIRGYKVQNMCTSSGVILNVSVIPSNEHDQEAMFPMVREVWNFFGTKPRAVLGDTAYGHGAQRALFAALKLPIVAPVTPANKPAAGYDISAFKYDKTHDHYICPNELASVRKKYIPQSRGWQYSFAKKDCVGCPLRMDCTSSQTGRRVFQSDYYDLYESAKTYNVTPEGKQDLTTRMIVERKNQELKNDCSLGRPLTRSKKTLKVKSYLAAIVVNFKHMLRRLIAPKPGFIRRQVAAGC